MKAIVVCQFPHVSIEIREGDKGEREREGETRERERERDKKALEKEGGKRDQKTLT